MTHLDDLLASMKQLHPLLIDLSLERVERMLAELGSPHKKLPPVIHIAGTNGKGSTTAFLKAMLEAAGKRVHVYTSPHLVRFNERIALAGPGGAQPIDEDALAALLQRVADVNAGQSITFFEITTAAAFLAFSETPADFLLLEVGLGGRLDTTNVVDKPALTIITPISMDHADKLGDTVEKIAAEKAGILKRGVACVTARQTPEVDDVMETEARKRGATLIRWGEHFEAFNQRGRLVFQREDRLLDLPLPSLIGPHQIVNAGTAVAAALELGIDERSIATGLTSARWPARMQRLGKWCPDARDQAGLRAVARRRPQSGRRRGPRPHHGRSRGAVPASARAHCRHDGAEGRRGLPAAVCWPRAVRHHGAGAGRPPAAATAR